MTLLDARVITLVDALEDALGASIQFDIARGPLLA